MFGPSPRSAKAVFWTSVVWTGTLGFICCIRNSTGQNVRIRYLNKEVQLILTDVSEVHLELDSDLEGEEQLVFLKDAGTAVVIDVVSQRVHYVAQATTD